MPIRDFLHSHSLCRTNYRYVCCARTLPRRWLHTQTHHRRHQTVDGCVPCSHVMTVSAPTRAVSAKHPHIICITCDCDGVWSPDGTIYISCIISIVTHSVFLMLNVQYRRSIAAGSCTFSDTFLETLLKVCVCVCVSSIMTNQNTRYLCSCRNFGTFCLCNTVMIVKACWRGGGLTHHMKAPPHR